MKHSPIRLGAHVSISGGIAQAPLRAHKLGCEGFQIFNTSPRTWRQFHISPREKELFRAAVEQYSVGPVFIHTIYLTNLASSTPRFWELSVQTVIDALYVGRELGAAAVVTHIGSPKEDGFRLGLERVHEALRRILYTTGGEKFPRLCLEFSAGTGNHIGKTFSDLQTLLEPFGDHRLGITLDTAHLFASGIALRTPEELEAIITSCEQTVGLERVEFIHLNDSKVPLGGGADRHEDIGKGEIGVAALKRFVQHPKLRGFPMILETPGLKSAPLERTYLDGLRRMLGIV